MFLIILSSKVQKERLQKERVATDVNTRAQADAPCAQHLSFRMEEWFSRCHVRVDDSFPAPHNG